MRAGNAHPRFAPHDVYRCAGEDAWVAIAVETDVQFKWLCSMIGRVDLSWDARFATAADRLAHRDELRPIIEAWTSQRGPFEAQVDLQSYDVPAGAALNCLELLSDPHVAVRGGFEYTQLPNSVLTPYPRVAFTLSETPVPITSAGPAFGGANDAVFGELLGLTVAEIETLERDGISPRIPAGGH